MSRNDHFVIRKATVEDATAISDLIIHSVRQTNSRDYSPYIIDKVISNFTPDHLIILINTREVFVAVQKNRIIGTASFDNGVVRSVFILPENQGFGVGASLVHHIEEIAKSHNVARLRVPSSITAEGFYQKLGYISLRDEYYGEERTIIMEKHFLNSSNLNILPCTSEKQWQAARIYRQKYFFDKVPMDDPYSWTFDHKDHQHFVLYNVDNIIGYAHIQLWPESRAAMRIIVVDEDHRKSGFGRCFVEKIEEWLKGKGFSSLHVESSPTALDFYTTMGYTPMPFDDPDGYEGEENDIALGKNYDKNKTAIC